MPNEIVVELVQLGPSTTEAHIRQHTVIVDRPEAKGGADQGPMGGELFLAAVGGCFSSNLLAAIRARGATVAGVRVKMVGILADAPVRYDAVQVHVAADCEDRALLKKLVDIADRGCLMMNTLRGRLELTVHVS
jgi:putative redox protein